MQNNDMSLIEWTRTEEAEQESLDEAECQNMYENLLSN